MSADRTGPRHVVGTMTGTSMDGIDVALVRVDGGGADLRAAVVSSVSRPLGDLAEDLRAVAGQTPRPAADLARLAWRLGELHARAIADLLDVDQTPDLIAAHGQTVFHTPPHSWQLLNPAPIARRFGCPVVTDLRQADLAAGGEGAPITPRADWILYRDEARRRAIVNLGGFANVTWLPAASGGGAVREIDGGDVCACNLVLDAVARTVLGAPFDRDGRAARAGTAEPALAAALGDELTGHTARGRSLGTGDESGRWVQRHRHVLAAADLAATAVEAIAACIAERLRGTDVDQVILAGGGAANAALVEALARGTAAEILLSDAVGIPISVREAAAIAILGALCADGEPITLPRVTGCTDPAPLAGQWTLPGGATALLRAARTPEAR